MKLLEGLSKDCLDIGVFTGSLEPMLEFWQQTVGLEFDHMLPVGGGVRQHRHELDGSVFKLNHARDPLAPAHSGYLRILIARAGVTAPREMIDPDGNRVVLVPQGHNGITQWAIEVATGSVAEFQAFYESGLGLPAATTDDYACAVSCGRSLILGCVQEELLNEPLERSQERSQQMRAIGITYTTIQVKKVDSVYEQVLANGGLDGRAPITLGETARFGFVRDRRGSWMELSQRASLTGSLEIG